MKPITATPEQIAYWTERDLMPQRQVVIGGPEEGDGVIPCPALISKAVNPADCSTYPLVHVAFRLDEIEVARLAQGGTLWLTTWGGLPVHLVEVV